MGGTLPRNQNAVKSKGYTRKGDTLRGIGAHGKKNARKKGFEHRHGTTRAARPYPLVLFMGFIGASLRYLLELAFPAQGGFPLATLCVNIFGCFMLEIINQYVGRRLHLPEPLVKSLGVGLIGAFTTISAFSTECLAFLQNGAYGLAALYVSVTLFATFLASLCGKIASEYLALHRLRRLRRQRAHLRDRQDEDAQTLGGGK